MIAQKIENVVNFIREARDDADDLSERIMLFIAFLLIGFGIIVVAVVLCSLIFIIPKVIIPLYFTIFILWQGYKRL